MRLLYVFRYFPAVSETFNIREALALQRRGFSLSICALERQSGPSHRLARPLLDRVAYFPRFARLSAGSGENLLLAAANWVASRAVRHRAEFIHAHFVNLPAAVARAAHHATGIPYGVTAHATDIYSDDPGIGWNLEEAAVIPAANRLGGRALARRFPKLAKRIRYAPSSLDMSQFRDATPGRASFDGPMRLLVVSRLIPVKGVDQFLEACALLSAAGVPFRADVAGDGEEGPRLKLLARRLGVGASVRFHGALPQEKVLSLYRACDVVVQPSRRLGPLVFDSLPNTVLEGMAMRRPVVASRIGAIAEAVRDGGNALLVPHSRPRALADAIMRLRRSPGLAARLGENGRRTVEERYDVDRSPLPDLLIRAARGEIG